MSTANGITVLRANWTFLRRSLTDLLKLFNVSKKTAYITSVKVLGSVTRAVSFVGVGLQAVEIASLVKEWNARHPEAGAVDELLEQLREIKRTIHDVLARLEQSLAEEAHTRFHWMTPFLICP
ncbi:hypothetical protein SprV_0401731400 [Sparganum proliferum]